MRDCREIKNEGKLGMKEGLCMVGFEVAIIDIKNAGMREVLHRD